ncbi:MAG: TadE/TadG family type IV pilus assembly protein [Pseudomonadota bacterium]
MRNAIRYFLRDEHGSASIEFAIVFPAVMVLFLSVVEIGYLATRYVLLERGLDMASRDLRLGREPPPGVDAHTYIKDRICQFSTLGGCEDNLLVELREFDADADFPQNQPTCINRNAEVQVDPLDNFIPGAAGEIMFIRACFLTAPLIPGLGFGLSMPLAESGGYQMVAFTAFMNEPN